VTAPRDPPATPLQALIFDVFGTVVDWRTGVAAEVAAACAARGVAVDAPAFADAWRARYQPAMQAVRSGARAYVALDLLHREMLDATLDAFGVGRAFDPGARAALTAAWEKLPPWPDAVAGLARLKRRFIVAPCSNGSIALMTRLARFGGLPWDCILGAEIARAYKPDPAVYRAACAALRLPPEAVTMVAAHEDDLAAARAEGLGTAFVPRPPEHGPGQAAPPAPTGVWDLVAPDFLALADRLERRPT
jgi:2-haloacid dehalogenase